MSFAKSGPRAGNRLFTDDYVLLVDLLRAARERSGLSQRDLGDRIGRSASHICMIERQQRRVELVEFLMIARALDCDPHDLIQVLQGGAEAANDLQPEQGHRHAI